MSCSSSYLPFFFGEISFCCEFSDPMLYAMWALLKGPLISKEEEKLAFCRAKTLSRFKKSNIRNQDLCLFIPSLSLTQGTTSRF